MVKHQLSSSPGTGTVLRVTPEIAGWSVLDFAVIILEAAQSTTVATEGREVAIVPQAGAFTVTVGATKYELARSNVFKEMAPVLYLPPGSTAVVTASDGAEFAVGGAPAEGIYPVRLFEPPEMRNEVRGGGGATRDRG